MSRSTLESFVTLSDTLVRVFAVLAAISALAYFFSSRQLQKINRSAGESARVEGDRQRSDAQAQLSSAEKKIAELQSDNARLGGALEEEKEARLQIQRSLGPRGVSAERAAAMVEVLRPFAGHRMNLGYFTEAETAAFAERILDALKTAGWKPQVFKLKSMQPIYGVQCGGPNPDDPALAALTNALKIVDKHLTTEDPDAAGMIRSLQPQVTDQLWVLVALKRPHLRRPAPLDGATQESGSAPVTPAPN